MKLPNSLRALQHRNFRLFLLGQGTSQIGNWVQLIATSWLVYSLSGSTLMLGLSAFSLQIPMLFVSALSMMLTAASTNTVLQSIVPDELRGRVAALYVMSFLGMSPLGSLSSGWLADHIGSPSALAIFGTTGFLGALVYAFHFERIRADILPLYQALEIPPHDE